MNFVAIKMLIGDRARYAAILIGITCSVLLVTQQLAIFFGYMSRTWAFIDDSAPPSGGDKAADIWVMNRQQEFTEDGKRMQDTELYRVRGIRGVRWAVPMFKSELIARLPYGKETACAVVGLDDATLIGAPPGMISGKITDLHQSDTVVIDSVQAAEALAVRRPDGTSQALKMGDTIEINDHQERIVGLCTVRRNFFWQPVVYTTYTRALQMAPQQRRMLTYILVKASPGQDPVELTRRIAEQTGLAAYTNRQWANVTAGYVISQTGIAINFGIAVLLGFVIGTAIAGQSFYNFTVENLRLFGMLKAMGASGWLLLRMVMLQALIAGGIGYGLGVGGAALFGKIAGQSSIAFFFPWQLMLVSAIVVAFACGVPALISVRKVIRLEPSVVFRGA